MLSLSKHEASGTALGPALSLMLSLPKHDRLRMRAYSGCSFAFESGR